MRKFILSFTYALVGIRSAVKDQLNVKLQMVAAAIVIVAGFYFNITMSEWYVVLLCIGLVLSLEVVNSAIENMVDLVTVERLPLAGKIKDMAAGAVLIAGVVSFIIGILIFTPYVFNAFDLKSL